ncbi:hypothetical protein XH90_02845 [Bradyrhizobium sp. CCBAU 53338]|nr:hypothetical protein XH90_02845 [Bradyrhizobium sp. CCBAU 53338]
MGREVGASRSTVVARLDRATRYAAASRLNHISLRVLDRPNKSGDRMWRAQLRRNAPAWLRGIRYVAL